MIARGRQRAASPTKAAVAQNMLYHEYCGRAQRPAPTMCRRLGQDENNRVPPHPPQAVGQLPLRHFVTPVAIIDCSPLWLKTCHRHVFLTRRARLQGEAWWDGTGKALGGLEGTGISRIIQRTTALAVLFVRQCRGSAVETRNQSVPYALHNKNTPFSRRVFLFNIYLAKESQ